MLMIFKTSVADPDPHGSAFSLVSWIRIRIHEGQNYPQKWRKFKFWSARCSLVKDEDLCCSLDVLYGGNFWSKYRIFFSAVNFFQFFCIKTLDLDPDPDPHWPATLDPDPYPDPSASLFKTPFSSGAGCSRRTSWTRRRWRRSGT